MTDTIRTAQQTWPRWIATILAIIVFISLIVQLAHPVGAADLWWHMALGRHILESGSLIIDHSIFTWTPATSYHVYNSWLADIILYLTYDLTGPGGLIIIRYSIFFLLFLLGWRYAATRGISANPITWLIIIIALALTRPSLLIKPELFTIGFMIVTVWLFFHMRASGDRARHLPYLFPLMLVVWINMHGAFFISSIFFAAAGIGEILNSRFCPSQAMPPRLKKHFFIALALCLPAILVSPFGYELPLTIIREVLTANGTGKHILAYRPTYMFNGPPFYMLDYMIAAMLLFVFLIWQKLKARQTDWVVILIFLGYSALFTQLVRVTYFLGPVFLFVCLDLLAKKSDSWAWPSSKSLRVLIIILCVSLTSLIGWRTVSSNSCSIADAGYDLKRIFGINSMHQITEAEYIKKNLSGTKIGNVYRDGGYLLYQLWPEKQVMVDPRYFPFKDWIEDYFAFAEGKNIEQFTKNHRPDYWLINYNFTHLFSWFNHSHDWKIAFLGPRGAIFIPSDHSDEKPIISPDIATMTGFGDIVSAFIVAIQLDDLTFAKRLLETARNNLGNSCYDKTALIREMGDTITGVQAYTKENYEETVRLLGKKTKYIAVQSKAADALMKLAEQSWMRGDILSARNWYLKVFDILPRITMADIYNFALLDWSYRHSDTQALPKPKDDLNWKKFATYILMQKEKILPEHRFIMEKAKAMLEERYDGTARLIRRSGDD